MMESIYVPLDKTITMITDEGAVEHLTCVESTGCDGCEFKRNPGKPQHPFCKAVACGSAERLDCRSVIFQQIKVKGGKE